MSQKNPPLRTFSAQIDESLMRRFKSVVAARGLKYRDVLTQLLTQFCERKEDAVASTKIPEESALGKKSKNTLVNPQGGSTCH